MRRLRILGLSDDEIRRQFEREIAAPRCPVCREMRGELVSARVVALEMMDRAKRSAQTQSTEST